MVLKAVFLAFQAKPLNVVPSLPLRIDTYVVVCLLVFDEITFIFSITNLGSLFPDPNGAKQVNFMKKFLI